MEHMGMDHWTGYPLKKHGNWTSSLRKGLCHLPHHPTVIAFNQLASLGSPPIKYSTVAVKLPSWYKQKGFIFPQQKVVQP